MSTVLFLQADAPTRWMALREFWPMLVPPLVGFVAIYLLLPQARHSRPLWAVAVGVLAVIVGAGVLIHSEQVFAETVLFWSFALVAVGGGGMMVTQSNPVYAALSFALVVLSTCGLFLLQAAPFLMAATIIIYAGAIVVTFLFVIMLAQQEGHSNADMRSREPLLASLTGCVLLAALLCVLHRAYDRPQPREIADLAEQLQRLTRAKSVQEVYAELGEPRRAAKTSPLIDALGTYLNDETGLHNLEGRWATLRPDASEKQLSEIKRNAGAVLRQLQEHYSFYGVGGPPRGWETDTAVVRPLLPAANVEALGQTLFTDYLVPIELAAVLLLVATIGAIVIAGRKSEELR
jgi:NADH:ubiquinone oxidoreductase subunit 6 (subunit J)